MKFNIGISIDLGILIESRLLVQANSGGGKSYAIRKLLEETYGKVQILVLDLEGEFSSLREKFDFVVFGNEGDYPIHMKYADKVAKTLLEHNVSAIIDLYELKHHERISFVKRFLESMINAPKELWHPCIVVIDEAHLFCPEKGSAESSSAVIDLCTRGRKRGYCAVLATQRLSKLNKDAAAECNNKMIGRTGLDVDMKRAGDELGFTNKVDLLSLRNLDAGNFYGFGPAINNAVTKFKISPVQTYHPKTGARSISIPPASEKVKKILSQFENLPQEAEKELRTEQDLRKEVTSLRIQLAAAQKVKMDSKPIIDTKKTAELKNEVDLLKAAKISNDLIIKRMFEDISKAANILSTHIEKISNAKSAIEKIKINVIPPEPTKRRIFISTQDNNEKITGGALRMLKAAGMYFPKPITKSRMGAIAGLSFNSGSFGTYLATLKRCEYLEGNGNEYTITEAGLNAAGEIQPLPDNLVEMWCNIVKGGASRMLQALADVYPNSLSRSELGEASDISSSSGTFGTYLATLKRNGLIKVSGSNIKASDELF